jgi:DegV family protein with EDD domain
LSEFFAAPTRQYCVAVAGVAVVTDSTSSLAAEVADRAGITVIALQVVIDGDSRPENEVDPALVAAALREGRYVTTSRPAPEAFAQAYEALAGSGHEAIVSVHLSAAVSGTVQAAEIAACSATVPVTVVDSQTLGMATGFAAISGAEAARSGRSAVEVSALVRARASASVTYFCVDSLGYLHRGGRVTPGAAGAGAPLAAKSLLAVGEGQIRPYERARTASAALARLEELSLAALNVDGDSVADIAVHHFDAAVAAGELAARLAGRTAGEVVLSPLSAVLGGHVGPGTIGVVISPRPPDLPAG